MVDAERIVAAFAESVRPIAGVTGFYVGGSLATGDFHPGVSDFDLVALVEAPLHSTQRKRLQALHQALIRDEPLAAKLHCVYVPIPDAADATAEHPTWAHGELFQRHFSGVARAELLAYGITTYGPSPDTFLPEVSRSELDAYVRSELTGYWSGAVAKPRIWLQDVYVDLGLVTLARVEATLAEGRLITKREAIPRLARFGVSADLIEEIARRRAGQSVEMTTRARRLRAREVRELMVAGIASLTTV